jgi:hypothetical protein
VTTFDDRERSAADSEPRELFRFSRGSGDTEETWLHVNGTEPVTFNGETYDPTPGLRRGPIGQSQEDSSMQVEVSLPRHVCVAAEYIGGRSIAPINLTIYRQQIGLDDSEAKPIYDGETSSPVFEGSELTITCKRGESRFSERLGRVRCQQQCPWLLFDVFCGADPDRVTFNAKITDISDDLTVITVEEQDAPPGSDHLGSGSHYYQSGTVTFKGRKVSVISQDEDELTLQTPLVGAEDADIVGLIAGCDRTTTDCEDIHDNIERFGGFPLIPDRNPWKGVR